jgi:hypothetical protein
MEQQKGIVSISSNQNYLSAYNPDKAIVSLQHVVNLPDVWRTKTPSLARINREAGTDLVVDLLSLWITRINKMLNITNPMSPEQITYTARQVFAQNPMLTIADIKLVFDRSVTGQYGKDYNRLDSSVICSWFRNHWEERLQAAELAQIDAHASTKPSPWEPRTGEMEKEKMREAMKQYLQK